MDKRHDRLKGIVRFTCAVLLGAAFASSARADTEPGETDDLTSMSLEDLMSIQITSVSKQKQTVAQAPAAVTAIGQEDIRRSGLNSIPELLRLVPGLDVARINASHWAISSRGFNELYSRQLLVVMDGRSVYTPLFSGVYWDTLDYMMPDLDRIEVIRGPGATLWGANAVNGVINITTKSARDTQGFLLTGEGSTVDRVGGVRYGGKIDDDTFYRVYTKYSTTEDFDLPGGDHDHDGWDALRGGFRIDRYAGDKDVITFQGDGYSIREGQQYNIPVLVPPFIRQTPDTANYSGGNLLARWTHTISEKSDFSLQFYYDRLNRSDIQLGYTLDTYDLDFQHRFALSKRQEVIWAPTSASCPTASATARSASSAPATATPTSSRASSRTTSPSSPTASTSSSAPSSRRTATAASRSSPAPASSGPPTSATPSGAPSPRRPNSVTLGGGLHPRLRHHPHHPRRHPRRDRHAGPQGLRVRDHVGVRARLPHAGHPVPHGRRRRLLQLLRQPPQRHAGHARRLTQPPPPAPGHPDQPGERHQRRHLRRRGRRQLERHPRLAP